MGNYSDGVASIYLANVEKHIKAWGLKMSENIVNEATLNRNDHCFLRKFEISKPDKCQVSLFSHHLTLNTTYTENFSSYQL